MGNNELDQSVDITAASTINSTLEGKKKKPKRSGCFWFLVALFMLAMLGGILLIVLIIFLTAITTRNGVSLSVNRQFTEEFESGKSYSSNKIAVNDIEGVIANTQSSWGHGIANSALIVAQLKAAAADSAVKVIILRLNTPGGEVTAADNIYHEVIQLRKKTGKPVIASMGSVAASGGV